MLFEVQILISTEKHFCVIKGDHTMVFFSKYTIKAPIVAFY